MNPEKIYPKAPPIDRLEVLHQHYYEHIRRFCNNFDKIPSIDLLYQLARKLDWYNCQEPIGLSDFIKRYLTSSEQELFDIAYPKWLVEHCEHKLHKYWDPLYYQKKNNLSVTE